MGTSLIMALGCLMCLGVLYAWHRAAPAEGSGWILFVAVIGTLGFISAVENAVCSLLVSLVCSGFAGYIWNKSRHIERSGWVLCIAVIAALSAFGSLFDLAG